MLAQVRGSLSCWLPGQRLTCLRTSFAACAPPARTIPTLASHLAPLTSPLSTMCKLVFLPGQCQRYPLYWQDCTVQSQHGSGGERDGGEEGVPSACWQLEGSDRQGTLGSLHSWSPMTLGSEVGLAQHLIPMCSAAVSGGAGPSPQVQGASSQLLMGTGSPKLLAAELLSLGSILHLQVDRGSSNIYSHGDPGGVGSLGTSSGIKSHAWVSGYREQGWARAHYRICASAERERERSQQQH